MIRFSSAANPAAVAGLVLLAGCESSGPDDDFLNQLVILDPFAVETFSYGKSCSVSSYHVQSMSDAGYTLSMTSQPPHIENLRIYYRESLDEPTTDGPSERNGSQRQVVLLRDGRDVLIVKLRYEEDPRRYSHMYSAEIDDVKAAIDAIPDADAFAVRDNEGNLLFRGAFDSEVFRNAMRHCIDRDLDYSEMPYDPKLFRGRTALGASWEVSN